MSIYRISSSTPTSIFSEAEPYPASSEKPTHESVSSPAEPLESQTQRVWEHFHAMPIPEPIPGAQKTLDQFFAHQDTLEGRTTLPRDYRQPLPKTPSEFRRSPPKKSLLRFYGLRCPAPDCRTFCSQRRNLKNHILKKHKNDPEVFTTFLFQDATLKCIVPGCPASYARRDRLFKHLREKHQLSFKSMEKLVIKVEDWK